MDLYLAIQHLRMVHFGHDKTTLWDILASHHLFSLALFVILRHFYADCSRLSGICDMFILVESSSFDILIEDFV